MSPGCCACNQLLLSLMGTPGLLTWLGSGPRSSFPHPIFHHISMILVYTGGGGAPVLRVTSYPLLPKGGDFIFRLFGLIL